jgi:hypothetical protein
MAKTPGGVPDVLKPKTAEAEKEAAGGVRDFMAATKGKVPDVLDKAKTLGVRGFMKSKGGVPDVLKLKTAEAQALFTTNLERMGIKVAEDAINPSHIAAGAAEAPKATAAGENGGEPVGGAPKGPTSLIGSNGAAIAFTRGQAYKNRKGDMKQWLTEPMDSAAHDSTLQAAFAHTSEAGPKVAAAQTKTAAARAVLEKLIAEVQLPCRSSALRRSPVSPRRRRSRSAPWSARTPSSGTRSPSSSGGRIARRSHPSSVRRVSATSLSRTSSSPSRRRRKPGSSTSTVRRSI